MTNFPVSMSRYAAVCLIALAILPAATPALAQEDETPLDNLPHITIVGTAAVEMAPDLAVVTLGVTAEKPTAAAAADETARNARAVIEAAKAQGIAPADIATQSVTLAQTFDDVRDQAGHVTRKPRGFTADNIVTIKLRDLAKAGPIVGSLIAKGANRLDGIAFALEHREQVMARLVGEAVRNARGQAESAAAAAGVRLGRVLLIERPSESEAPARMYMHSRLRDASTMPVEAGTLALSTAIEVTWSIGPR